MYEISLIWVHKKAQFGLIKPQGEIASRIMSCYTHYHCFNAFLIDKSRYQDNHLKH